MTMDQFEQKLEREKVKELMAIKKKEKRWSFFWDMANLTRGNRYLVPDPLPITLKIKQEIIFLDDVIAIFSEDKIVWNAFDEFGKLIVFTMDKQKNVNLVFKDQVLYGKIEDINEKDDPEIPDLIILTCVADGVTFTVSI